MAFQQYVCNVTKHCMLFLCAVWNFILFYTCTNKICQAFILYSRPYQGHSLGRMWFNWQSQYVWEKKKNNNFMFTSDWNLILILVRFYAILFIY